MAYLTVAAGGESSDVTSAAWSVLNATYRDARSAEAHGGAQAATVHAWFSAASQTAKIGFALCGKNTKTVYAYKECMLAAGARRSAGANDAGNYLAYPAEFGSATAAAAYAATTVENIDLKHGAPSDYNTSEELEWRFGVVTDPASGSVYVSAFATSVI